MADANRPADVCLLLEGTYPYVAGGVSAWVHDLIKAQSHLSFALVAIVPDDRERKRVYEVPANVVSFGEIALHRLPPGEKQLPRAPQLATRLVPKLERFFTEGGLSELAEILAMIAPVRGQLGENVLLNAPRAFKALCETYAASMPQASFLHYFWSWRALATAFFAVALAPLPKARVYHAISTGYAGLMAARAAVETGRPFVVTEHGIYTNERRIEIALAEWLHDPGVLHFGIEKLRRDLKDLWTGAFAAYSRAAYQAATEIVTLYRGNQEMQIKDGAPLDRLRIVPNGIDYARLSKVGRSTARRAPTVALIGRVVPIKDIKTYIRAIHILRSSIPGVQGLVLGPLEEDPDYARECRELATHLGLERTIIFTGRVKLDEYLPYIDINVLTSVSEAQPLVLLEVGAAGIPSVATDVGSCSEILLGMTDEEPPLGAGGAIVPLASPIATAAALRDLLGDRQRLARAGQAIRRRVQLRYNKPSADAAYREIYERLRRAPDSLPAPSAARGAA